MKFSSRASFKICGTFEFDIKCNLTTFLCESHMLLCFSQKVKLIM